MEIELKYIVDDKKKAEEIFVFLESQMLIEKKNIIIKDLNAIYYDTKGLSLKKNKIALRTRRENEKIYATLKWGGSEGNGLHKREEYNILLEKEELNDTIDIELFKNVNLYEELKKIVGNNKLVKLFETKVIREIAIINLGETVIEFVYDNGKVFAENNTDNISEIEIELMSGSEQELIEFGDMISKEFNISPSSVSKFERGLKLII